jgi:hypothetical protein
MDSGIDLHSNNSVVVIIDEADRIGSPRHRPPLCNRSKCRDGHNRTHAAQQQHRYSITSSARSSNVDGISSPSAFAVFTLMTSWNLVA